MKIARKRKAAGILPEDFQTRPALSRQLFAIRLMNTIFPPQTTRNLPGRYKAMFAPTPRDIDVVNEYSFSSMPAGFNWAQLPPSVLRFIAWTLAQGQFDAGEIDRAMLDNLYALIYEIPPPPPPPPPGVPHWYVPPDPEWRTIVPPLPAPTPGGPVPPWGFGPENPPTIRTPSPIGGKWYNYTDDTCWREADFFFTWTGTAWHMEQGMGDGEIRVATGATWYL
ncbi:MAG: hypothetical protein Q8M94_21885, partial [Ignavibacteria bacterium]|nr:hypothetical protein [Ignavibacteria bacterium]